MAAMGNNPRRTSPQLGGGGQIVGYLQEVTMPATSALQRRHDVDWLRVMAMGLLIVYHIVLSFQPWARSIRFPQNDTLLEGIWPGMALINIWRIPLLFLVSGMGVRFAMERRDWKQLILDRTIRTPSTRCSSDICGFCSISSCMSCGSSGFSYT